MELIKWLDFRIGDTVQIKNRGKYRGRVGIIIGSKLLEVRGKEIFNYTVKFSDCEGVAFSAPDLILVRPAE